MTLSGLNRPDIPPAALKRPLALVMTAPEARLVVRDVCDLAGVAAPRRQVRRGQHGAHVVLWKQTTGGDDDSRAEPTRPSLFAWTFSVFAAEPVDVVEHLRAPAAGTADEAQRAVDYLNATAQWRPAERVHGVGTSCGRLTTARPLSPSRSTA